MNTTIKYFIFFVFSLVFSLATRAQFGQYRLNHDRDPYYFGLSVGYNNAMLHATRSKEFLTQKAFNRIEPKGSHGLEFGLLGTVRLSGRLEARLAPKLIISGAKSLQYYYDSAYLLNKPGFEQNPEIIRLPATIISTPVHLKLNSDRIGNFKVYMFAGLKYDINLSANNEEYKKARQLDLFPPPQFRPGSFGYEAGVGFSIYLPFTVVSPEIRIGNTFGNSHIRDAGNPYSNALDKFNSRMIQFSLNFEE